MVASHRRPEPNLHHVSRARKAGERKTASKGSGKGRVPPAEPGVSRSTPAVLPQAAPQARDLAPALQKIIDAVIEGYDENAVREDVVTPLLNLLGYQRGTGAAFIEAPEHLPIFSSTVVGRKSRKAKVPDYVLVVDDRRAVVVEAKRPTESVDRLGFDQCLSYAFDRRIRADLGVVCNGNEIAVYPASDALEDADPLLRFRRDNLPERWRDLFEILSPGAVRYGRLSNGLKHGLGALPKPTGVTWVVERRDDGTPLVHVRMDPETPFEVQSLTPGAAAALADLPQIGSARLSTREIRLLIGREKVDLTEHFSGAPEGILQLTESPTRVDWYVLAPRSLLGVRLEGVLNVDRQERQITLGALERGLQLVIDLDTNSVSFAVGDLSAEPVLKGMRVMEFVEAVFREGEISIVNAVDGRAIYFGSSAPRAPVNPRFVEFLRLVTFVALKTGADIKTPETYTTADAEVAIVAHALLNGQEVGLSFDVTPDRKSGFDLTVGSELSVEDWYVTLFGATIPLSIVGRLRGHEELPGGALKIRGIFRLARGTAGPSAPTEQPGSESPSPPVDGPAKKA